MKVIDLLNKIAKGEEIPKKILCDGIVYTYNPKQGDYYEIDCPISLFLYENFGNSPNTKIWLLSDNIEILEDKTEEDTTKEIEELDMAYTHHNIDHTEIMNKINELVRAVNKLNNNTTYKAEQCMTD